MVSTRILFSAGKPRKRDPCPGKAGNCPTGVSALMRHSTAWPAASATSDLRSKRSLPTFRDVDLLGHEIEAGDRLGDGMLEQMRAFISRK